MTSRWRFLGTSLIFIFGAVACSHHETTEVGVVELTVTTVPVDVKCISLTAMNGNSTVVRNFDVTPSQSASVTASGLPTGTVTLSEAAYNVPCAQVAGNTVPTWISDGPVVVQLVPGQATPVSLVLRRAGQAIITNTFTDDVDGGSSVDSGGSSEAGVSVDGGTAKANGAACAAAGECVSGFCSGGVCCDQGCTGICQSCNLTGTVGSCRPRLAQTTCGAASCTGAMFTPAAMCDGNGACKVGSSVGCGAYLCGTSACKTSCASNADCATGYGCQSGACVAAKATGTACAAASECASGFCSGGVCCDQSCTGICQSCNMTGTVGSCRPKLAQTTCGAASCVGAIFTPAAMCDGNGACKVGSSVGCGAYVCGTSACKTSCASNADCATGRTCKSGVCS
jgi:hypothetical protein